MMIELLEINKAIAEKHRARGCDYVHYDSVVDKRALRKVTMSYGIAKAKTTQEGAYKLIANELWRMCREKEYNMRIIVAYNEYDNQEIFRFEDGRSILVNDRFNKFKCLSDAIAERMMVAK